MNGVGSAPKLAEEEQQLTGFGLVVISARDIEFDIDSVGGLGYVCYVIDGLISILLLLRIGCSTWMEGKWGKELKWKGEWRGRNGDVPVISSGKMESRTSRSSICSS